jgi:type I restriction enzyme S subunit
VRAVAPDEAARVEVELARLETMISGLIHQNRTLAQLRDILLPQLMSGKLRVHDAAKTVDEAL